MLPELGLALDGRRRTVLEENRLKKKDLALFGEVFGYDWKVFW